MTAQKALGLVTTGFAIGSGVAITSTVLRQVKRLGKPTRRKKRRR